MYVYIYNILCIYNVQDVYSKLIKKFPDLSHIYLKNPSKFQVLQRAVNNLTCKANNIYTHIHIHLIKILITTYIRQCEKCMTFYIIKK